MIDHRILKNISENMHMQGWKYTLLKSMTRNFAYSLICNY